MKDKLCPCIYFRNGSIVASYLLELNDVSSIRQAVQDVNLTLRQGIQNASITNNYDLQIEQTKTLALLDTTLQGKHFFFFFHM